MVAVKQVIQSIGAALKAAPHDYVVVVRSTLLPGILEEQLAPTLFEATANPSGSGLRICNNPEFLRESTAIHDYDHPPYVLVGTTDDWDPASVMALYQRITADQIVTDSRTASLVKYACNAFHALKIAFANEMGSLAKNFEADGSKVMKLVCRDVKLNISPAYLRPGFAFGGSCLPKDVRALTRHAEKKSLRLNVLGAILPSNNEHLQRAIDIVERSGHRKIGLVGLSFKPGTDDLRESPFVRLAETLLGRGYDLRIYDPGVSMSRLRGRNLAYVDQHLPHLAALLVKTFQELSRHAHLLLAGTEVIDSVDLPSDYCGEIIDLRSTLITAAQPGGGISSH